MNGTLLNSIKMRRWRIAVYRTLRQNKKFHSVIQEEAIEGKRR